MSQSDRPTDGEEPAPSATRPDLDLEPLGEKPEPTTGPKMLVPLFLVPLLIVAVIVGIFLGFSALVGGPDAPADLIARVETGGANDRWQAAAALIDRVVRDPDLRDDDDLRRRVRRVFENSRPDDVRLRWYLARLSAALADPGAAEAISKSLGEMVDVRDSRDASDEELDSAINGIAEALGRLGDRSAEPVLLRLATHDEDVFRQAAAAAFGSLYFERGAPPAAVLSQLSELHADDNAWIRMNAALALAKLGSTAGLPTLEFMLDRENLRSSGLGLPDDGQFTVANSDRGGECIASALLAIEHLSRVSAELHSDPAEVERVANLVDNVLVNDPSSEVRRFAGQALAALRKEDRPDAEEGATSGDLREDSGRP